jgi:phosphatidyl-myo-inositol alpha-mannosyltransferase
MVLAAPFPAPRGTQAWVAELSSALLALGHTVHLWCYAGRLGGAVPAGLVVHRAPPVPGVRAEPGSAPSLARPLNDAALLATLLRDLRRFAPSVVHGHNHEGGLAAALAGRAIGVPVVHQIHGALAEELPAWGAGDDARRPLRAGLLRTLGRGLDHGVPRLAARVLALDAEGAATAGMPQVTVLPPAVTQTLPAAARPWPGAGPWVAYAGNLDPYQCLPLLEAAWARVRSRMPAARLAILTHDRPPTRWTEQASVTPIPVSDGAEALSRLASADVAVVPRTGGAGYPVKLLNALGAGVPVVACRPAAKGLGPEAGVWPVAPDAEALAGGLLRVLEDPSLRRRLAAAACDFARSHPWRAVAEAVGRVYDAAAGG